MALAERARGAFPHTDDLVALLSGYRSGAGIITDGRLIRGWQGRAGELRVLAQVRDVGSPIGVCYWLVEECRHRLETTTTPSILRQAPGAELTLSDIIEANRGGDPIATQAMTRAARRLGRTIAAVCSIVDSRTVVICGQAADVAREVMPIVHAEVARVLGPNGTPNVVPSQLGNQAVLVGAITRAVEHARQISDHIDLSGSITNGTKSATA